jgi:hypothetical protein
MKKGCPVRTAMPTGRGPSGTSIDQLGDRTSR